MLAKVVVSRSASVAPSVSLLDAAIAENAGLNAVMDRCVKIEHARFHGGLHLAGFNTGVISSKRQVVA